MTHAIGFERFMLDVAGERDFDVRLEAKAKDLAVLRLRERLAARGFGAERGRLTVRHWRLWLTRHRSGR